MENLRVPSTIFTKIKVDLSVKLKMIEFIIANTLEFLLVKKNKI